MSRNPVLAIDAGTLFTPAERLSPARVIIDGGSIAEVGPLDSVAVPSNATRLDLTGFIVTPGFIDPHIHGCGGVDVMTGTYDALNTVSRTVAKHGTTSFLATTVSSPPRVLTSTAEKIGSLISQSFDGARPVGIHLEGPFIDTAKRGTHKPAHVLTPDAELLRTWVAASKSTIRLITLAPELPNARSIIEFAVASGIRIAMGHSNASFDQTETAVSQGVCYAVHTFNAMREFSHRDPGIVGAVLSDDRLFAEIIADGVHVHPAVVKFFARAKTADRILLVTDAISATEMPDGEYNLGQDLVSVKGGVCRNAEGRLAGSTLTQDVALKNFVEWTDFSIQQAVRTLTLNPATVLGLRGKGVVEAGADADLAVLGTNFQIMKTFVAGKLVFER